MLWILFSAIILSGSVIYAKHHHRNHFQGYDDDPYNNNGYYPDPYYGNNTGGNYGNRYYEQPHLERLNSLRERPQRRALPSTYNPYDEYNRSYAYQPASPYYNSGYDQRGFISNRGDRPPVLPTAVALARSDSPLEDLFRAGVASKIDGTTDLLGRQQTEEARQFDRDHPILGALRHGVAGAVRENTAFDQYQQQQMPRRFY